ncbi:hypothetical protein AAG906_021072 [Vitis piasezkii]
MVLSCYHRFDVNYQGPHAPASSTSQTGPTPLAQAMIAAPSRWSFLSPHYAKPFVLHNVLHVPQLTSNLISVSKFYTDNNTILEFHPSSFFVKDKDTKVTFLQGQLERGLYKFPTSSISSPTASSKHQVFLTKTQPTTMFHKIPFSLSTSRVSSPLELIHADLLGPSPVPSSTGARYFLLLMDDYSRPPLNVFKQTMVESSLPSPGFYLFMALTSPSHQSSHFPVTPAFPFPPSPVLFPSTTSSPPTIPFEPAPTSPPASSLSLPPLIQVPFDSTTPIPSHLMTTRSKSGICKKKTYLTSLMAEPRTVKQALQDPNWKLAMEQEYQALLKNQTWSLVPPPSNAKIIGCKWVFKLKHKPDGSIDRRLSMALNKRLEPGSTSSAPFSYSWDSNAQGLMHLYFISTLYFLGIEVTRLPHVLHLNQQRYIHQLLDIHGALGKLLSADGEPLSDLDATHYRSLLLSAYRYLKGTATHGLSIHDSPSWSLQGYQMRIGLHVPMIEEAPVAFVFFCTNLISWSSTKQRVVSRSSAESEYRALAFLAAEVSWVQFLLKELCIPQPDTPLIWCDNISAAALAANSVFHARSKHIEIDLHFVRDKLSVLSRSYSSLYCPETCQLAGDDRQAPAPAADSSPL